MKILLHLFSFLLLFLICLSLSLGIFGISIATIIFVTWSLPPALPFTWTLFRVLCVIAFIISLFWSFSKENKEWVEKVLKDLKGKENGNS